MTKPRLGLPNLGFGVGLRSPHFQYILDHYPEVDWFEVISENYIDTHGWPRYVLDKVKERYPVVMHGVSLSIGSSAPLNMDYLKKLKKLAKEVQPVWVSDHLCWTGVLGRNTHDLLPVALNEESLRHVVDRIRIVQDVLERPLVLENPSSYLQFANDTLPEWAFISQMALQSGCGLLLDINNVYVSSVNHSFDPVEYIRSVPADRVVQFHLAGHTDLGTHIIDTHDGKVVDPVWELYRLANQLTGGVSTLLEWDEHIPDFPEMHAEVLKARNYVKGEVNLELARQRAIPEAVNTEALPHPLHVSTPLFE